MKEKEIAVAVLKYHLRDLRLGNLEGSKVKAKIGDLAQKPEFSSFSKEELLDFFKEIVMEMLQESIQEVKAIRFTSKKER